MRCRMPSRKVSSQPTISVSAEQCVGSRRPERRARRPGRRPGLRRGAPQRIRTSGNDRRARGASPCATRSPSACRCSTDGNRPDGNRDDAKHARCDAECGGAREGERDDRQRARRPCAMPRVGRRRKREHRHHDVGKPQREHAHEPVAGKGDVQRERGVAGETRHAQRRRKRATRRSQRRCEARQRDPAVDATTRACRARRQVPGEQHHVARPARARPATRRRRATPAPASHAERDRRHAGRVEPPDDAPASAASAAAAASPPAAAAGWPRSAVMTSTPSVTRCSAASGQPSPPANVGTSSAPRQQREPGEHVVRDGRAEIAERDRRGQQAAPRAREEGRRHGHRAPARASGELRPDGGRSGRRSSPARRAPGRASRDRARGAR